MSVSVIILSHRRVALLARVLSAVALLRHPSFEVIVVGDQPVLADYAVPPMPGLDIHYVHHPEPGVSAARNAGLRMAGGDIVAFCDDDAIPEPGWLDALLVPFALPQVGAVGGAVLDAKGAEVEWHGSHFDRAGTETPAGYSSGIHIADAAGAVATSRFAGLMGTNMAVRRAAVLGAGGFDEAYRYYLDETDMALRLAGHGWSVAFSAEARVWHCRAPNAQRDERHRPQCYFEIGASKAYFCKQHLQGTEHSPHLTAFEQERQLQIDRQVRLGLLRSSGRTRLLASLHAGYRAGTGRQPQLPFNNDSGQSGQDNTHPNGTSQSSPPVGPSSGPGQDNLSAFSPVRFAGLSPPDPAPATAPLRYALRRIAWRPWFAFCAVRRILSQCRQNGRLRLLSHEFPQLVVQSESSGTENRGRRKRPKLAWVPHMR